MLSAIFWVKISQDASFQLKYPENLHVQWSGKSSGN